MDQNQAMQGMVFPTPNMKSSSKIIKRAKHVKLGIRVSSVDGKLDLVSFIPTVRKSDRGTKILKSLCFVKGISYPRDGKEVG